MSLQILLLKKDQNQVPADDDLHPPAEDLIGRFIVDGDYDAVVLAVVPEGLTFATRNRLPLDGVIYLIKKALVIPEPNRSTEGIVRW